MKKFVSIALFIFLAVGSGVVIVGSIYRNQNNAASKSNPSVQTDLAGVILSKTELGKHNSAQSCWLLISGKVYDVTTFLPDHPGEAKTILPTCGTDATQAFNTMGKPNGRPHSSQANAMLADYYIGDLNQKSVSVSPNTKSTPVNSTKNEREGEDD